MVVPLRGDTMVTAGRNTHRTAGAILVLEVATNISVSPYYFSFSLSFETTPQSVLDQSEFTFAVLMSLPRSFLLKGMQNRHVSSKQNVFSL